VEPKLGGGLRGHSTSISRFPARIGPRSGSVGRSGDTAILPEHTERQGTQIFSNRTASNRASRSQFWAKTLGDTVVIEAIRRNACVPA